MLGPNRCDIVGPRPCPTPPRPARLPARGPRPARPHTWTGLAAFLGTHRHRRLLSWLLLFPLPSDWAQRRRVCERRQGCLKQNTRHCEGNVTNTKPRTRLCVCFTHLWKRVNPWNSFLLFESASVGLRVCTHVVHFNPHDNCPGWEVAQHFLMGAP